ncbi:MAG TPA: phenylacetate--CoA ligase [Chitinivibrionales bacterium]|nr:phenylacetate--CoA ligase [Chitinivibrionales bacterium]
METSFLDKRAETRDRPSIQLDQLRLLRETVDQALKTPFYQKKLNDSGVSSGHDIKALPDITRLPFTTKNDLRDAYPRKHLAVPVEEVVRVHMSSGTTGIPTVIYYTREDLDNWTLLLTRSIIATGCKKGDVFQNMMTYGLFTGGLGLHYGAEKAGMMVIPAGSGNTKRQLWLMKEFRTTVVHATPSYMLHIYSELVKEGYALSDLRLKKAFLGAEPYSENTRKKIEDLFKIDAYNSYGLSEMNGPGVAFECEHKCGMHVWEDSYIVEVINPETMEPCVDGEEGELVFTTLRRRATPLLRYRTRDLSKIISGPCACGRTHRRIDRIMARTDDMLIINGVNVFPSQIEEVLMHMPEMGTNYQIVIDKKESLDRMTVKTEVHSNLFKDDMRGLDALSKRIRDTIKSTVLVNPVVELHEPGMLPVYEGKAKRVIDNRPAL